MNKALTPMTAKTRLRKAIREALGLRSNAKIDVIEEFTNTHKNFKMVLPSSQSEVGYRDAVGFTTYYFPGCCKYGVVSQLYISGTLRGKKLSYLVLDWALAQISMDGYSKAVGTTANRGRDYDTTMEKVLKKAGWKRIDRGENANTENIVSMWIAPTGKTNKSSTFMDCDS